MDLPRLCNGGVDLQVFSVVSKVSALLFIASLRSPATWFSSREQALAQANELRQLTEFRGTSWLQPVAHIWLRSAQPWVQIDRNQYHCFNQEPDNEDALRRLWQAQT